MSTDLSYHEKDLLRRVAAGDESAFRDLLRLHHGFCYGLAFEVLKDNGMAEDIVQEVFLKLWLRRSTIPGIDNFGGWLRKVTVNLLYDYIKKRKAETGRIDAWFETEQPYEPPAWEEGDHRALIHHAITLLPARQQQALRLIKLQGYSREEAARMMGVSPDTVKTHLAQAMRTVRAYCLGRLDHADIMIILFLLSKKYF